MLDASPAGDFLDAASSGGEVLLIVVVIALVFGVLLIAAFFVLDGARGSRRANRRRESHHRQHKDLEHRIAHFARSRQAAVSSGQESPEAAIRALEHYGEGVLDSVASTTRNVRRLARVRELVALEVSRLQAAPSRPSGPGS